MTATKWSPDNPIVVSIDDMTMGEMIEAEKLLGKPINVAFAAAKPKMQAMTVLALVVARRTAPDTILADIEALKWGAITFGNGEEEPGDESGN